MRRGLTPSCFYPPEQEIAELILGPGRVVEWRAMAVVLERSGLPTVDKQSGARCWPAVEAYFNNRHGLITLAPGSLGPTDGSETCIESIRPKKRQVLSKESDATVVPFGTGARGETS